MKKNFIHLGKYFTYLLFLTLILNSCSKDDDEQPVPITEEKPVQKSNAKDLLSISFSKANNTSFTEDAYVQKSLNNLYYITLPNNVTSRTLTIEIVSSNKSSVKVNNVAATTIAGKYNNTDASISKLSVNTEDVLTIEVIAESGSKNTFEVLAQPGIKEFDKLIYAFKDKYDIPGVSYALANNSKNEIVYKSGVGYGIKETKTRVKPSHLFRLASMSKQHTAICAVKLIEEGKFKLDDLVFGPTGLLKDKYASVSAKAAKITVRHLLEHTTGYSASPDYMFDSPYSGFSMDQRIEAMLKSTAPNDPGTSFAYYNTGYGILGYLIEKFSGKTFETYMKELYAKVGVTDIHVGGTQSQRRSNEVAYYAQNGYNAQGADMNVRASAGGIIASTEQLFKLLWTIDGKSNIPDLMSADSRKMMFTPSKVGTGRYALGWRANHSFFPGGFYHGGNLSGVATFWVYGEEYSVAFLCNSRSYLSGFDDEFYVMARDIIAEAKKRGM